MTKKLVLFMAACAMTGLSACTDSETVSNCAQGDKRCENNAVQVCTDNTWSIETQCEAATLCNATSLTCEANTCNPNDSKRCNGKAVEICTNGAWNVEAQCSASETCNAASLKCDTVAVCTNDSKRCNSNAVEICANGAWSIETQCEGTAICNAVSLQCEAAVVTCEQGTTRCTSNGKLETCQSNTWIISDCGAEKTCPAGKTACEVEVCVEGQTICNLLGNAVATCTNNTLIESACVAPTAICNMGKCVACSNGEKRCEDNAVKVCDFNTWTFQKNCGNLTCDPLTYNCIAVDCQAGWKRCNGNVVEVCNAANKYEPVSPAACATGTLCLENTSAHTTTCVACKNDTHCTNPSLPVCHTNNTCVACHAGVDRKCNEANGRLLTCNASGAFSETKCDAGKRCEIGNKACTDIIGFCRSFTDCKDPLLPECYTNVCSCKDSEVVCKVVDGIAKLERCFNHKWGEYSTCVAPMPVCNTAKDYCAECSEDIHCGDNSKCDTALNKCKSTLPVSTLICDGMGDRDLSIIGYVTVPNYPIDPTTITAKLYCGKINQRIKDYEITIGQYLDLNSKTVRFIARPFLPSYQKLLCVWSFQKLGEQPIICGKNRLTIKDLSTYGTEDNADLYNFSYDHFVGFENFKPIASYTNEETVVDGMITTTKLGYIAKDGDGSYSGNTLVFGNRQDHYVTVTNNEAGAYIHTLSFHVSSWGNTDEFKNGQRLELFLDDSKTPYDSLVLNGVYSYKSLATYDIKMPVKSFRIEKKKMDGATAQPPRLRIDSIRWSTHAP